MHKTIFCLLNYRYESSTIDSVQTLGNAMNEEKFFEDYCLGSSRVTAGRTITETDFVIHAGHTGAFFSHHMDAEFMKTQAFGQRIAPGTRVFAQDVGLTAARINPVAVGSGYDRLRFIKPVFI